MANNFEVTLFTGCWEQPSSAFGRKLASATYLRRVIAFSSTTSESVTSQAFVMPASYTGSGTLKLRLMLKMYSAITGKVRFNVEVEAITPGDAVNTNGASSFDTANGASSATVPGTSGYIFELDITLSSKDSVAAGDMVRLRLTRDVAHADDDSASDVYLETAVLREVA